MNLQINSIKSNKDLKAVLEKWNKKILPFLPKWLDDLARQTGVIQRKRGIGSAADLLKILFYMHVQIFLSVFWLLLLVHLEYPIFPILYGENTFQNRQVFCMKSFILCYHHFFHRHIYMLLER